MKKNIILHALLLLYLSGISQLNKGYEYTGRFTPSVKQSKINEAKFISDIMPDFCNKFRLGGKEYARFTLQIKSANSQLGNYMYPNEYFHKQENYEKIMDYVSLEISTICNGKSVSAQSNKNSLSKEQKNILNSADAGSDISIKIKFKYKFPIPEYPEDDNKIYEGQYIVTVVPDTEAQYPGGFKQISNYITENVINKIPKKALSQKVQNAIVNFTINEEGKIINTKMERSSTDQKVDLLLINAINRMPNWKPAQNAKGIKVRQEYSIPLSNNGGC